MRSGLMAGILLAVFSTTAVAGTGSDRLQAFLNSVDSLHASFEQALYDEHGKRLEQSTGVVYMQRPGRFRWDYRTPYEQLIVADGEQIWIYDTDLEQVTVKALDTALRGTPAFLVASDRNIEDEFLVHESGEQGGLAWVTLTPRDEESSFTGIKTGFDDTTLREMELVDNLGQTTRLRFSRVFHNVTIDPDLFHFTPPAGVDVIGPEARIDATDLAGHSR